MVAFNTSIQEFTVFITHAPPIHTQLRKVPKPQPQLRKCQNIHPQRTVSMYCKSTKSPYLDLALNSSNRPQSSHSSHSPNFPQNKPIPILHTNLFPPSPHNSIPHHLISNSTFSNLPHNLKPTLPRRINRLLYTMNPTRSSNLNRPSLHPCPKTLLYSANLYLDAYSSTAPLHSTWF